ncbi:hypothetical protein BGZ70_007684 [Mortierella alpina]|uniref:Uncharacterized protein n=1 Tax=Mortierella alpina TaxID=64518 RepID=A0A9P6JDI1_MORAP|nr:hypothetical protein BGZ70_007684 [Mortierella alpina]
MSLYGDLPPPSTSAAAEGPSKNNDGDAKDGTAASGAAKSVLPAGWSSSITRLKPMLNRKLAPPKARPAQRTIPAGFVAQSVQEPYKDAVTTNPGITASSSSTPRNIVTAPSTGAQHASGNTLDENSWLKARIAQVQRTDNDVHALGRKQMKRTPVKAQQQQQQQGPISLDDEGMEITSRRKEKIAGAGTIWQKRISTLWCIFTLTLSLTVLVSITVEVPITISIAIPFWLQTKVLVSRIKNAHSPNAQS